MSKKKYNEIETTVSVEVVEGEASNVVSDKRTLEKIISVTPQKVKRSLFSRLVSGVLGPEGVSGIGEYVNDQIVKPAIKNIIVDAVTSGINMIMYGERGGSSRGYQGTGPSRGYQGGQQPRTNYTSRYTQHQPEPAPAPREVNRTRYDVEQYLINSRNDAVHVLVQLTENAEVYGRVSVADYYDLIGITTVYTDNDYGWSYDSIARATITPVGQGYVIRFPQVEVI